MPGVPVHVGERLQVRGLDPEVYRLGLVDPFLAPRRRIDDPFRVDVEGGEVLLLKIRRDPLDVLQFAVEVLQVVHHVPVPKAAGLEVLHKERIEHDEFARRGSI